MTEEVQGRPGLEEGIRAGIERAQRHDLDVTGMAIDLIGPALESVIANWRFEDESELHERFIALFAENATVAAIARVYFEPVRVYERFDRPSPEGYPVRLFEAGEL